MRTEDDLRAALAALECHAPDPQSVLAEARARSVVRRRHRNRSLIAGAVASAIAVAATVVAVSVNGVRPTGPVNARVLTIALVYDGPLTGPAAPNPAAVLRMLADKAAAQPTPALGPVLYSKTAIWGIDFSRHRGLDYRSRDFRIRQVWTSAGARYFTVTDPSGKPSPGFVPSGYSKVVGPRQRQFWNWINPATLPAGLPALRRHLLGNHLGVFGNAFTLMTEPLRPAVRASLLRLMADDLERSGDIVLGAVTDAAGHRGIAIASSTRGRREGFLDTVSITIFDAATGAPIGVEDATCNGQISNLAAANARCSRVSYEQFLVIKAVRAMPRPSLTRNRPHTSSTTGTIIGRLR